VAEVEAFAKAGHFALLIDDFNDRQDPNHDRRVAVMRQFFQTYPRCRFIFTATEHLAQPLQLDLLTLAADFKARIAYIEPVPKAEDAQIRCFGRLFTKLWEPLPPESGKIYDYNRQCRSGFGGTTFGDRRRGVRPHQVKLASIQQFPLNGFSAFQTNRGG
jgi:hypothetical protein